MPLSSSCGHKGVRCCLLITQDISPRILSSGAFPTWLFSLASLVGVGALLLKRLDETEARLGSGLLEGASGEMSPAFASCFGFSVDAEDRRLSSFSFPKYMLCSMGVVCRDEAFLFKLCCSLGDVELLRP